MIEVTDLAGNKVLMNPDHIIAVYSTASPAMKMECGGVLTMHGETMVSEKYAELKELLNESKES